MRKFCYLLIATMLLTVVSCDRQGETIAEDVQTNVKANLDIQIGSKWGAEDFAIQQVYYDNYGNRLRVDNFMTYISMLTLVKNDGTEILLKDFYLHDFEDDATLSFQIDPGIYTGIRFAIGIPSEYNLHNDPALYPSSHPLSVAGSQGMFWTWNSGYIFSKLEGKADTTATEGQALLYNYSFHTGDAGCYMVVESDEEYFDLQSGTNAPIKLNFYVDEIFGSGPEGINVKNESVSHGSTATGIKVANRIAGSIHIE